MSNHLAYVPITEAMFRAMRRLDPVQVADLMDMISVYAFDGDEPSSDGVAAAVFEAVRPGLDWAIASILMRRSAENVIPDSAIAMLSDEDKPHRND